MKNPERESYAVIDKNGVRGIFNPALTRSLYGTSKVLIRTIEGTNYLVPADALVELSDGSYFLSLSLRELSPHTALSEGVARTGDAARGATVSDAVNPLATSNVTSQENENTREDELVVPIIGEEAHVGVREVERAKVRINKTVTEREEVIDQPLQTEEVTVERIVVNQPVDAPPPVRYEGDVMIVPLVEEVLVVERRLVVREELHIAKRRVEVHKPQTVVLRREEASVERIPIGDGYDSRRENATDEGEVFVERKHFGGST